MKTTETPEKSVIMKVNIQRLENIRKGQAMNFNYHIRNPTIRCPYCDENCKAEAKDPDDDYILGEELETQIEFECENCGKNFWAESGIVYSTFSDCVLNGEQHEFHSTPEHPTLFHCKNCYQYEVRPEKETAP